MLAVLVQYTPLRYCAFERVVLGSNCHDRGTHLGEPHADESTCGFPADGHDCLCERPKVDAQHDRPLKFPLDWVHVPVAAAVPLVLTATYTPSPPDPDPHRGASIALQLPLLI